MKLLLLLVCADMILPCSSQSLFHRSFHEFRFHLWGVLVHHQQGMLWGMYHPTHLAKWRQVLLYACNSFYGLIKFTINKKVIDGACMSILTPGANGSCHPDSLSLSHTHTHTFNLNIPWSLI